MIIEQRDKQKINSKALAIPILTASGVATLGPTGALAPPSASVAPPSVSHELPSVSTYYQFVQNYRLAN